MATTEAVGLLPAPRGGAPSVAVELANPRPDEFESMYNVQLACYPSQFWEPQCVCAARAAAYPAGALVARMSIADVEDARESSGIDKSRDVWASLTHEGRVVVGYGQMHPWPAAMALTSPPCLSAESTPRLVQEALDGHSKCMFIHEITVAVQGRGIGSAIMRHFLRQCATDGFKDIYLVAVLGNESRWGKFGFQRVRVIEGGYGLSGAVIDAEASTSGTSEVHSPDVLMSLHL